ncbi:MAG: SDR family NAD(P)-dependent oxidoreductase [Acutalibacteraceae bacterium]
MKYTLDLSGKRAVITGAAGGIGLETAKGLLENGCEVCLADFNGEANERTKEELTKSFPERKIIAVTADMTKSEDTDKIIDAIKSNFGDLDILINNAGTGKNVRSLNETKEGWEKVINLNLNSYFYFSQKIASEFFVPKKQGNIINMCSLSAYFGVPNAVAYSSSKGAVLQMTKSLADEWARFSIRVNCVCPGFVETPLIADNLQNERWMAYMQMRIPMKRLAKPEDVVGSVLFLASDLSAYITGSSIIVDGGFSSL